MVSDLATAANRGRVMGAREAAAGIGAAIGPLVGGFIYDHLAHWVAFIANGVLLGCAALLVLLWFPHSSAAKAQVH
jgi:MFS family permease